MAVNLSIKDVPDDVAERLRQRAKRHHRSLQGELMAIIEAAAPPAVSPAAPHKTIQQVYTEARAIAEAAGLAPVDESADIVRAMRDAR